MFLHEFNEFVQYSFSIQPTITTTHGGSTGGGWVWTLQRKFKLLTLLNYRQYNPRTSWEHGYPLDPLEHFSGSVHYHAAFFQFGNKTLYFYMINNCILQKNCHKDKTLINQK